MKPKKIGFKKWLFGIITAIFRFRYVEVSGYDQEEEMEERAVNANESRYFIDFRPGRMNTTSIGIFSDGNESKPRKEETIKVSVKPIDVYNELEKIPTRWSLEGLDDKLGILRDKLSLIQNNANSKREVSALIELLENRKKYYDKASDGQLFWQYFAQYDVTNDQKIQKLLGKYKLVMESADIFIPEFPGEAIFTMTEFSKKCKELCNKDPKYFVIATEDSFNKVYGRRDPILLAQSPFGFYYHILGAWDKEMLYLPEL